MKKVAFVTYNSVGDKFLPNGWHEFGDRSALVLQNSTGARRFAERTSDSEEAKVQSSKVSSEIDRIWNELELHLGELDHVVVYVGANGSQRAIQLASKLTPSKVTFVLCDCSLEEKRELIEDCGMGTANFMMCECGGRETMRKIYDRFTQTGEVNIENASSANTCLTDQEIEQVFLAGPSKLWQHDENSKAHMHLLHSVCKDCTLRLVQRVALGISEPQATA